MKYQKITFLFPGQGAQYPGMGKDFFEKYPLAKDTFEEADKILGYKLSSIVLEGPAKTLTETKNSQTGIYLVSIAMWRVIHSLMPSLKPFACAGLSLGEYTALAVSERMTFTDGLLLVQKRGQYMNDACEATKGSMAVIVGLKDSVVEDVIKKVNLPNDIWAANFNCPEQVVISGTLKGIDVASAEAKARGAKMIIPLQVHGAFHSGLMQSARDRLEEQINQISLKPSDIALVMNVNGNFVKEEEIKPFMIQQVTSPVRWEQGIRNLAAAGTDLFVEIGCGKTLTNYNKRMNLSAKSISIEKIADLELFFNEIQ